MKERKIVKLKIVAVVIGFAVFFAGYLFCANYLKKPLTASQLDFYQQVARDVYEHGDQIIVEAPDEVSISKTATTITVSPASEFYVGSVIAKLKDGELVFTRDAGNGGSIFMSILMGIIFCCGYMLIIMIGYRIYKKVKK